MANELIEIGETTIHKSQEIKQLAKEILDKCDEVEQLEEKAKKGWQSFGYFDWKVTPSSIVFNVLCNVGVK